MLRLLQKPLVLFGLALAARLVAMLLLETWRFSPTDHYFAAGWESGRIAWNIVNGEGYSFTAGTGWHGMGPTAWIAPLYPTLLSSVFWFFGSFTPQALIVILVAQSIISSLSCLLVARVGSELSHERAGCLAALALALAPSSINQCTRIIWGTNLLSFEILWLILLLIRQARSATRGRSVGIGILMGATLLTSPAPIAFIVFAAVVLYARQRFRALPGILVMSLCAFALVVPWIVRNHAVFGSWFFIKSNFGNELFIGNHEGATGRYRSNLLIVEEVLDAQTRKELATLDELQRSRMLGDLAEEWILEHPWRFVELTATRMLWYWRDRFIDRWEDLPLGPLTGLVRGVHGVAHDVILVLALLGAISGLRSAAAFWIPVGFLVTFPLAYYVTHVGISRYSYPFVPVVLLLAAVGIVRLWALGRSR